ncbi:hypothetical protein CK203_039897 [Vitis vinifera]|uniref:Uncharacterized protein n=1 Tax=Vitis vinifera TaxID=29760 RepID=A0A438I356_VITVI|nr:hypothetical protein CK203_039897 [Vitis vinifera]
MWRSLQKQDMGTKQREQSTIIQGVKFLTMRNSLLAHECHFAHLKPFSHRVNQGAKISHTSIQGAKFIPCETFPWHTSAFHTPQAIFRTVRKQGAKLSAKLNPRREAEETSPRTTCEPLELTNNHRAPFRPWKRLGKVFSHPHPRRCLDQSSQNWRRHFATYSGLYRSPSEGERLLSIGIPPGGYPLTLSHPPPKPRGLLLGHLRRGPSSRASYNRRTTYRGQPGLQRSILPLKTWFDVEALRQQPELRDSFRLLQRVRNPTLIHFTIDGRQGAIGARHIAEALRIPYEPVIQADFREWSSFSQRDMVRILSRGTSTASFFTRRELPSGMLLIDVLLRANIFPLQYKVQRRGAILEALFRISEGYYFGPHHLIMTSLLHFEEKVYQKKLQRADVISIVIFRLLCQILEHMGYSESPALRGVAIAERTSLSTNGITWQPTLHLREPQLCLHLRKPQMCPHLQSYPKMSRCLRPSRMRFSLTLHLLPLQHTPQCTCLRLHFLLLLSLSQLHQSCQLHQYLLLHLSLLSPFLLRNSEACALVADPEHRSGFSYPSHGHYSCTPGSDHCYSDPAYHDPSLDPQHLSMQTLPGHDRSGPSKPPMPDEKIMLAEQPIPDEEIRAEPSHDPTTI